MLRYQIGPELRGSEARAFEIRSWAGYFSHGWSGNHFDAFSHPAARALHGLINHGGTLLQGFESHHIDFAEMGEDIGIKFVGFNEAKTLVVVKPFDNALCHETPCVFK